MGSRRCARRFLSARRTRQGEKHWSASHETVSSEPVHDKRTSPQLVTYGDDDDDDDSVQVPPA